LAIALSDEQWGSWRICSTRPADAARRLSRCYEGTEASARTWLEVASVGYLASRAVA